MKGMYYTMAKKVTIKEQFTEVAEVLKGIDRADLAEFIEGRIAVLDKKSKSENKKATEKQIANAALTEKVVAYLNENEGRYRAGELAKVFDTSTTHISALLTKAVKDGAIKREVEHKIAYFSA